MLIASTAFGMADVLQKIAFNNSNFITGYVFFTMGTFAGSMAMLIPHPGEDRSSSDLKRRRPNESYGT